MAWTCTACSRQFGRTNQSHGCAPAGAVDDYFAGRPALERKIYDRVIAVLQKQGPLTIQAVGVGIMIKRTRTFAELRRRRDHMELGLLLSRQVEHPRIKKRIPLSTRRCAHMIALATLADIDRDVRGWLAEAYLDSPPRIVSSGPRRGAGCGTRCAGSCGGRPRSRCRRPARRCRGPR